MEDRRGIGERVSDFIGEYKTTLFGVGALVTAVMVAMFGGAVVNLDNNDNSPFVDDDDNSNNNDNNNSGNNGGNNGGSTQDDTTYSSSDIKKMLNDYGINENSQLAKVITTEVQELTQTYNHDKGVIYSDINNLVSKANVKESVIAKRLQGYDKSSNDNYVVYWLKTYAELEKEISKKISNKSSDFWTKDFAQVTKIFKANGVALTLDNLNMVKAWIYCDPSIFPEACVGDGIYMLGARHTPAGWDRDVLEECEQYRSDLMGAFSSNAVTHIASNQEYIEGCLNAYINECSGTVKSELQYKITQAKQLSKQYYDDVVDVIQGSSSMSNNLAKGANMAQDLSRLTEGQIRSVENSAKILEAAKNYYAGESTASDAWTLFKAASNHEKTEKDLNVTKGLMKSKGPKLGQ